MYWHSLNISYCVAISVTKASLPYLWPYFTHLCRQSEVTLIWDNFKAMSKNQYVERWSTQDAKSIDLNAWLTSCSIENNNYWITCKNMSTYLGTVSEGQKYSSQMTTDCSITEK